MRVHMDKDGRIAVTDFSPAQAYKIAVKMEQDGMAFYKALADRIKDEEARREIGFLIEQEQEHLATFTRLLEEQEEGAADGFEEDDIVTYMNARVFDASEEHEAAGNMGHRHTALEEALNMERRSIVFYEGCAANTTDPEAKKAFTKIIEEEEQHLKKFGALLRTKCIAQGRCLL